MVPRRGQQAHHLADELHARLKKFERLKSIKSKNRNGRGVSDMPGLISANLYFDEIVNIILPLTSWWPNDGMAMLVKHRSEAYLADVVVQKAGLLKDRVKVGNTTKHDLSHIEIVVIGLKDGVDIKKKIVLPDSAMRLLILIGIIGFRAIEQATLGIKNDELPPFHKYEDIDPSQVAQGFKEILQNGFLKKSAEPLSSYYQQLEKGQFDPRHFFLVSLDRRAQMSSTDAVKTIKADAARRFFEVSTDKINWTIIDSGIDAQHPAFRKMNKTEKEDYLIKARENSFDNGKFDISPNKDETRIKEKYDMTLIHVDLR